VEANAFGEVRGYLKQVPIEIHNPMESFDLSPFFGAGFLSVTKYLEGGKHPFTGKVMMEFGNLALDLALYHLKSEQVPSAFALSVDFNGEGEVRGAGGILIQALPGADDQILVQLEKRLNSLPSIGKQVHGHNFPDQWLQDSFAEFDPRLLDHKGVEFMCHCKPEQIRSMLAMLKTEDLKDMAENGPFPIQIRCHNCNTVYEFGEVEMALIYSQRLSRP
jgi:molecular chaperone Hsp33